MTTGDLFQEILNSLAKDGSMTQETKDSLILRGIISLYAEIESIKIEVQEVKKIIPLYKILVAIGGLLMSLIIGLIWKILTGEVQLKF